jgi:hypothetical protein
VQEISDWADREEDGSVKKEALSSLTAGGKKTIGLTVRAAPAVWDAGGSGHLFGLHDAIAATPLSLSALVS